jgi:tetratricopeptide (TPR) repeat protein
MWAMLTARSRCQRTLLAQRKFEAALVAYRQYLRIAEALVAKEPDNPQWQRDLGASNLRIGQALQARGDFAGALQAVHRAHDVFGTLVAKFPRNNWWRRDLGMSEQEIGDLLVLADRPEEALVAYRVSFETRKALAGQEPANSLWQQDLRRSMRLLVKTLLNLGKAQDALALYDERIEYGAEDVSVRWDRGQAELYGGRESAAAEDFAAAVKLRPTDGYAVLWLHIARGRVGHDDKQEFVANAAKLDKVKWPWPIVAFQLGTGTPESIMVVVDSVANERTRRNQTCEALFYLGVSAIDADKLLEARTRLESAVQQCPFHDTEHIGAVLELKRLLSLAGK